MTDVWPPVYRGFDARDSLPTGQTIDLTVTSTPYLWKSRYSDGATEFGAGSFMQFLADQVCLASTVWDASRPGAWYALNLGDTRSNTGGSGGQVNDRKQRVYRQGASDIEGQQWVGVPWSAALAVRNRTGWQLAGQVVWNKDRPVLSDVSAHHLARNRRPGLSHEMIFLFWKPGGPQTWNPQVLLETPHDKDAAALASIIARAKAHGVKLDGKAEADAARRIAARAKRPLLGDVWTIVPTTNRPPWANTSDDVKPFPDELAERLVLLLSKEGDVVLDPCAGYGTVGMVANRWARVPLMLDPYWGTRDWEDQ